MLAVPALLHYEIVSVVRKLVSQGRASAAEGIAIRDFLLAYPVQVFMDDWLLRRGYDLAATLDRPAAYDTQYLAVALHLGCEFWTADQRLFNAISTELAWVKWLGNFTA